MCDIYSWNTVSFLRVHYHGGIFIVCDTHITLRMLCAFLGSLPHYQIDCYYNVRLLFNLFTRYFVYLLFTFIVLTTRSDSFSTYTVLSISNVCCFCVAHLLGFGTSTHLKGNVFVILLFNSHDTKG